MITSFNIVLSIVCATVVGTTRPDSIGRTPEYGFLQGYYSRSLINQENSYVAIQFAVSSNNKLIGFSPCNVSLIRDNNKRFISSNALAALLAMPAVAAMSSQEMPGAILLWFPLTAPFLIECFTNVKLGYSINKNVTILGGLQTDYYLFYPENKINRRLSIETRFILGSFMADVSYNYSWSRGHVNITKPYFSAGLGYSFVHVDLDSKSTPRRNMKMETSISDTTK